MIRLSCWIGPARCPSGSKAPMREEDARDLADIPLCVAVEPPGERGAAMAFANAAPGLVEYFQDGPAQPDPSRAAEAAFFTLWRRGGAAAVAGLARIDVQGEAPEQAGARPRAKSIGEVRVC